MIIDPKNAKNGLDALKEWGPKVLSWLELAKESWNEFGDKIKQSFPDSNSEVIVEEETLTKEKFYEIIKANAVKGANGMAAFYKKNADDDIFYLASVIDKELIEENDNKFVVVIATDGVKKEVKEIFASAMETEYGKLIIIR